MKDSSMYDQTLKERFCIEKLLLLHLGCDEANSLLLLSSLKFINVDLRKILIPHWRRRDCYFEVIRYEPLEWKTMHRTGQLE